MQFLNIKLGLEMIKVNSIIADNVICSKWEHQNCAKCGASRRMNFWAANAQYNDQDNTENVGNVD